MIYRGSHPLDPVLWRKFLLTACSKPLALTGTPSSCRRRIVVEPPKLHCRPDSALVFTAQMLLRVALTSESTAGSQLGTADRSANAVGSTKISCIISGMMSADLRAGKEG